VKSIDDEIRAETRPEPASQSAVADAHPANAATPSPSDPTRTSQPDDPPHTAAPTPAGSATPSPSDPTRTSQPDRPATLPSRAVWPAMAPQLRNQDRYDILGEHGRGGLGRVSRAHDRELGRDIAIKELISRGHLSEVRFLREALITARLEHPGIVPVYEAGRWPDGTPFYAMKLVSGRPLRDLIAERKTVDERIGLLHHVIAVADAIAYAHGRNIIHRDLKPANVIVGEFGETVVIDWGLAKDLSAADEPASASGSFRTSPDDGLTSAGTVLGTPAYMAPEQARGEPVDRRADVFAIGALLWELCSLHKLPPNFSGQRRRLLRNAGIDPDLITIVEKAVDPDPARRYPDAGALAADLKAFKAGARIAARRYSLWGMLTHWIRRHLAIAATIALGTTVALSGIALYVRNIAIERDRAESAKAAAEKANAATESALAEQMLGHAEVLLNSDPSAASDLLHTYRGRDTFRLHLLQAQAAGRGEAHMRSTPHSDAIYWAHGLPGGSVATLSPDGTVVVTTSEGTSTLAARSSRPQDIWAFEDKGRLLAYVCAENEICLLGLSENTTGASVHLSATEIEGLALSPDSQRMASISHSGDLTIWDISHIEHPAKLTTYSVHGFNVRFLDNSTLAAIDSNALTVITASGATEVISIKGTNSIASSTQRHSLAIGTTRGDAVFVGGSAQNVVERAKLCDGPVEALQFADDIGMVVYGCKGGQVGLWNAESSAVTSLMSIQGAATEVAVSADSRYVAAGGVAGILSVYDLRSKVVSTYLGHGGRISAIASLDTPPQLFATADNNGHLRTWNRPPPWAEVVYTTTSRLFDVRFLRDGITLVTTGIDPYLHVVSNGVSRDISPHEPESFLLELAPDGEHFACFGSQKTIEIWDGLAPHIAHTIDALHSETVQLKFLSTDEIVYANNRGEIRHWSIADGSSTWRTFDQPVSTFILFPPRSLIVELRDGSLWRTEPDGTASPLPRLFPSQHLMQLSNDRRWLVTGNDSGDVAVYNTHEWQAALRFHASGAIHHIVLSPSSDMLAIATKNGHVYLGRRSKHDDVSNWAPMIWHHFEAHPRFLKFSPDGQILMITNSDGVIWFYSVEHDQWWYFPSGTAGLTVLQTAADGQHAATVDSIGRLMLLDLSLARNSIIN
jgi:WD40 repeat protein